MRRRWIIYTSAIVLSIGIMPAAIKVAHAHRVAMRVQYPCRPGGEVLIPLLFLALAYIADQLLCWLHYRIFRRETTIPFYLKGGK